VEKGRGMKRRIQRDDINDTKVKSTNDEATLCKFNLVQKKYIQDPFVQYFLIKQQYGTSIESSVRISPIISRGYFARVYSINRLIEDFLQTCSAASKKMCQIVSFGAGYDTRVFCMRDSDNRFSSLSIKYIEMDFETVVRQKAAIIHQVPNLHDLLDNAQFYHNEKELKNGVVVSSNGYILLAGDLRDEKSLQHLIMSIESDVPTLFLAEMVLAYMDPEYSDHLIAITRNAIKSPNLSIFIIYEPINPNDAFGKMMIKNLKNRGCDLKSIIQYPTCDSVKKRLESLFLKGLNEQLDQQTKSLAISIDMHTVYYSSLEKYNSQWIQERKRIERLEILDELEEFDLLMQHYALTIAIDYYPTFSDPSPIQDTWIYKLIENKTK
jgi:tRNA wybutosine-synthesizing protein 4